MKQYIWQGINSEDDLPVNDVGEDYPDTHIVKIGHDDGRGGSHVEELNYTELVTAWKTNDGWTMWLKPVKDPSAAIMEKVYIKNRLKASRIINDWKTIEPILEEFNGNQSKACKKLGVDRKTLYHIMKRYAELLRFPNR